ncbi:hypothetical protein VQH23_07560 [Pararoseomonas sp. SCSIO 73927]|uniref:hypothetical protein n=1 Tax=Pararoseomonas sp. SCSIO 73927 TaxID=3114537 RepID=UPI0030D5DF6C
MPRYLPSQPRQPAPREPWAVQAVDATLTVLIGLLLGWVAGGFSLGAGVDLTILLPEIGL